MLVLGPPDECAKAAGKLGIDMIGSYSDQNHLPAVIQRLRTPPSTSPHFHYLVTSDKADSVNAADLVTISNFPRAKNILKKTRKHGLGLEFLIAPTRKLSGQAVAKWLGDLFDAYTFCESSGCQFIISSGAGHPSEMVSGRSFDAILAEVGVNPQTYWRGLEKWLSSVTGQKVIVK